MIEFFNEHQNIPWYIVGIIAGYGIRMAWEKIRRELK